MIFEAIKICCLILNFDYKANIRLSKKFGRFF